MANIDNVDPSVYNLLKLANKQIGSGKDDKS